MEITIQSQIKVNCRQWGEQICFTRIHGDYQISSYSFSTHHFQSSWSLTALNCGFMVIAMVAAHQGCILAVLLSFLFFLFIAWQGKRGWGGRRRRTLEEWEFVPEPFLKTAQHQLKAYHLAPGCLLTCLLALSPQPHSTTLVSLLFLHPRHTAAS